MNIRMLDMEIRSGARLHRLGRRIQCAGRYQPQGIVPRNHAAHCLFHRAGVDWARDTKGHADVVVRRPGGAGASPRRPPTAPTRARIRVTATGQASCRRAHRPGPRRGGRHAKCTTFATGTGRSAHRRTGPSRPRTRRPGPAPGCSRWWDVGQLPGLARRQGHQGVIGVVGALRHGRPFFVSDEKEGATLGNGA